MPALLADFAQVFTTEEVFTPPDLAALGNRWPSINEMVASGKRVLVVSGIDYLRPMESLIFSRCRSLSQLTQQGSSIVSRMCGCCCCCCGCSMFGYWELQQQPARWEEQEAHDHAACWHCPE